jgi:hypothetical protein
MLSTAQLMCHTPKIAIRNWLLLVTSNAQFTPQQMDDLLIGEWHVETVQRMRCGFDCERHLSGLPKPHVDMIPS